MKQISRGEAYISIVKLLGVNSTISGIFQPKDIQIILEGYFRLIFLRYSSLIGNNGFALNYCTEIKAAIENCQFSRFGRL